MRVRALLILASFLIAAPIMTVDGEYLIFDTFNPVSGLWGIYTVSRIAGVTSTLVAPVPGLIIRNPALAHFTVQVTDDNGDTATQELGIKVSLPNCVNCHAQRVK